MRCFLSGELVEPESTHPKIAGLADVGGSPMGSPLIGFDKEAFTSYNLDQSANCAVSEAGAAAYRSGLNELIANHSERLADTRVAHWFHRQVPLEDDPMAWLMGSGDAQQELHAQRRAHDLLEAIQRGERPDLARNTFYALTLSGSAGRVMVRDWMEGQFTELVSSIAAWFEDLEIVHREGGRNAPDPKFLAVIGSTVRDLKEASPPFIARMWRVALRNELIPQSALAQALMRTRIAVIQDETPNHARMGLMKAYHLRNSRQKGGHSMPEDLKVYLNEAHPSPAYHCGRLMAVFAGLQRAALGDVGAGVVQRYYAAASSTPALILGRLARTSQFHLNKLEPGLAWWYESKLAEIWQRLGDGVPSTLGLEDQTLFALGYYQQLTDLRTKKTNNVDASGNDIAGEGENSNE